MGVLDKSYPSMKYVYKSERHDATYKYQFNLLEQKTHT